MKNKIKSVVVVAETQERFEAIENEILSLFPNKVLEVNFLLPTPKLETLLSQAIELNPDLVICDYVLNELESGIKFEIFYDGLKLMLNLIKSNCLINTEFYLLGEYFDIQKGFKIFNNKIQVGCLSELKTFLFQETEDSSS